MKLFYKYKYIIFDLDDTLFDYQATEIESLKQTCKDFGIPFKEQVSYYNYKVANNIAKKSINALNSPSDFKLFRNQRAKLFLENDNNKTVNVEDFVALQLKHSERGILIDGVYETIKEIHNFVKVIVGTNGSTHPRLNKIRNSKISSFINHFYSSEMLGLQKPNPEFYLKIIDNMSIDNISEVLVVGNDFNKDIVGAINAKIDCCHFPFNEPMNLNENVFTIESFSDLLNIIKP
ncbi:MAG: HAD-IA family hydrolase [Saprospiraceae bacterium]|nr:HAD-IA family hydrolase [Saprospiraceae bacterium]